MDRMICSGIRVLMADTCSSFVLAFVDGNAEIEHSKCRYYYMPFKMAGISSETIALSPTKNF